MKKQLTLALFFFLSFQSFGTVRTVCNMPYSPGQFTTLSAALTAANVFDTIYVHGSTFNYGNVTINKTGIVLIGAGYSPVKQSPLPSSLTTVTVTSGTTRCQLIGFAIDNLSLGFNCNYTSVRRCRFAPSMGAPISAYITTNGTCQNLIVEGCQFSQNPLVLSAINFLASNADSTIIRNNIFECPLSANSTTTNPNTFFIINNLFTGNFLNAFNSITQAKINNNIFYGPSPQGVIAPTCSMNHNISFSCGNNTFQSTGNNNLVNVNPFFVNAPSPGQPMTLSNDFRLNPISPGINSGNDGTDRGLFGGFGFKFNMTGEPAMAEVTAFTITSSNIIAPNGTLTISVTSKRIK